MVSDIDVETARDFSPGDYHKADLYADPESVSMGLKIAGVGATVLVASRFLPKWSGRASALAGVGLVLVGVADVAQEVCKEVVGRTVPAEGIKEIVQRVEGSVEALSTSTATKEGTEE